MIFLDTRYAQPACDCKINPSGRALSSGFFYWTRDLPWPHSWPIIIRDEIEIADKQYENITVFNEGWHEKTEKRQQLLLFSS